MCELFIMTNMSKETFIKKDDSKYIDLLDEDNPVAGQKFVCLSFLSPEKILKQKEIFFFEKDVISTKYLFSPKGSK